MSQPGRAVGLICRLRWCVVRAQVCAFTNSIYSLEMTYSAYSCNRKQRERRDTASSSSHSRTRVAAAWLRAAGSRANLAQPISLRHSVISCCLK